MCVASSMGVACDEEKPYTPFQVASSLPQEGPAPAGEKQQPHEEKPAAAWRTALHAPHSSKKRWKAFDRTLEAPSGTEFEVALPVLNSESDEVVAWTLPPKGKANAPEAGLWVFDQSGHPARKLISVPDYLPKGDDCRLQASLSGTGSATLTSELTAQCTSRLLPGTPVTSLVVVEPSKPDPEILHLRMQEAAAGEKLELRVDSHDHDEDGADDVTVEVSLTPPRGNKETLPLVWFARTAGASRQADSPREELAKLTSRLAIASIRKKERAAVPERVNTVRRLLSSLCSELGKPRITQENGAPLACGNIQPALEQLAEAEITAYLGEEEDENALGAFERVAFFGTAFDTSKKTKLKELVLKEVPHKKASRLAKFNVTPVTFAFPYKSPLLFSSDGQLFAKIGDQTKRLTLEGDPPLVIPATDDEPEKRVAIPEWSMQVRDNKGLILKAVLPSCDRSEVLLALGSPEPGQNHSSVPLPFLAPRPGQCKAFAPSPLEAIPLEEQSGAIVAAVTGQRVTSQGLVRKSKHPTAWGTTLGVALARGDKIQLLTGDDTDELHHCVTTKDASKVACLSKNAVFVFAGPG